MHKFLAIALFQVASLFTVAAAQAQTTTSSTQGSTGYVTDLGGSGGWAGDIAGGSGGWAGDIAAH